MWTSIPLTVPLCKYSIQYLAYILSTPIYGYVRGGIWKQTHAFIKRHKQTLILVLFWCLASPASKSEPIRRDQERPQKVQNCAVYTTTTPSVKFNRSQFLFSEDPLNYLPLCLQSCPNQRLLSVAKLNPSE